MQLKEQIKIEKQSLQDNYLQEVNEIIDYTDTHFYIDVASDPICYGVRVNIKDKNQMKEMIKQVKIERKQQIEGWNKEQWQRNIMAKTNL